MIKGKAKISFFGKNNIYDCTIRFFALYYTADTNKNNLIILYLLLNFIYKNKRVNSFSGCYINIFYLSK